jgi:DnaJ family protein B protein 4
MRANRLSQHFEGSDDFRDYFRQGLGGAQDFELFGPSSAGTRPRGDSRANSTSPATQVPPSPRPQNVDSEVGDVPTVRKLPVTLEELYYGTTKRVKIKRLRYHTQLGRLLDEEKVLDVPIYKGLKPGSKVKFQSEGDETILGSTKELHFVLIEVPLTLLLLLTCIPNT